MNNFTKIFLLIIGITFTLCLSAQTTYYVDASNGDDSNNGKATSSAWKTLIHVGDQIFSPGDKILLKSGEVFTDSLNVTTSGTVSAPITIGAYGTGDKPKIEISAQNIIAGIHLHRKDFVIVENIEITGTCRYGVWIYGGSNITIQDCYIHHIAPGESWHGIISNQTPDNIKILRNEISYCGLEGYYGSSENIEIAYNHIHHIDMAHAGGDCIQLNVYAKNFHVHHNIFDRSDLAQGGKGCAVCSDTSSDLNGIFEYNTCICAPGDNFGFSAPGKGSIVRYNTFKGAASSQFAVKGPHLIHHNVFDTYERAFDFSIASSDYKVYNNIFKNIGVEIIQIAGSSSGDRFVDYEFKNNISNNSNFRATSNGVALRSHNIYTSGSVNEPNSIVIDPKFVSDSDYHLQSSSPAINRGTPVGLSFDFEGNPIDDDTTSIGIYEYTGVIDSTTATDYPTSFNFDYEEQAIAKVVSSIDASGTTDINSTSLTFNWVAPDEFVVKSLSEDILSYIPPKVTESTSYSIVLNIFDGLFWSSDTVEVEVVPFNPFDERLAVDTATASGYDADTRMPATVLDDDIATRWAHEGNGRWIMFELTEPALISYLEMAFFRGTARTSDFDIQASNDGTSWTNLRTGIESCGFTIDTEAFIELNNDSLTKYKYVRILGHGNSSNNWNSYGTVHLYGITDTEIHLDLQYADEVAGRVASLIDASGTNIKIKENLEFSWKLPAEFEAIDTISPILKYLPPFVEDDTTFTVQLVINAGAKELITDFEVTVYPYNNNAGLLLVDTAVASGYDMDTHMPMNVLDDDLSTRWSESGDEKWIQLYLEYPSAISHFEMAFFRGTSRSSIFDIYASEDSTNWVPLLIGASSSGITNGIEVIGNPGDIESYFNYIKVIGHGNTSNLWNSFNNLKPFGTVKVTAGDKWEYNSPKKFGQWYNDMKLAPNPASKHVNIILKGKAQVRILTMTGIVMYEADHNRGNTKVSVNSFTTGMYIVLARFNDGSLISKKLIIE